MDTFLFEGSKVLFRISLAILKLNERRILNMTDPVTIFQCLKELTRQSFDVEELLNVCMLKQLKLHHSHLYRYVLFLSFFIFPPGSIP